MSHAAILLRMVPSGTPKFAASSQEAGGLCALVERSGHNQHEWSESSSILIFTGEKTDGQRRGVVCRACKNVAEVKLGVRFFILSVTSSWPFLGGTLFNTYSKYL